MNKCIFLYWSVRGVLHDLINVLGPLSVIHSGERKSVDSILMYPFFDSLLEIDRIQAFRYSQSRAEETNSTCVVCMSEYCFKEKIRKLPCTHDFHSKCIDKWLKVSVALASPLDLFHDLMIFNMGRHTFRR